MREREIFDAALAIADPAERSAYLAEVCARDDRLRQHLEGLLAIHQQLGSFLEAPALPLGATVEDPVVRERPGTRIGPYKLLEVIGEGGMGTVWLAQQTEPVKRLVAVKLIKAGMDSKAVLARFEAERQALALMDHPHIAKVHDAGTTPDGRPFFVMELVKGVPITKYCDEHRLTPRQRLELFVPVCQAIQHAHQKGIIHRDVKPSNVLVALYDDQPVPKVIDFGVAKATGHQLTEQTLHTGFGAVVGTLEYMSPEQASFNQLDVDTRSDIYALGVLLYELLAGSPPFGRQELEKAGMLEVLRLIREQEPPRPSTKLSTADGLPTLAANRGTEPARLTKLVRGELDWIVMKALEKDRTRRYETANGLVADVQRYLHDEAVQACPPSAWYRFRKFARRNKGRLAVAAIVFLAVTVMAATIGWAVRDRAARQAEIEQAETARRAKVEGQVRDSLNTARTMIADNKLASARAKLAQARAQLGNDGAALGSLAAAVAAGEAELDRFQQFLDLIDRAHEAETAPLLEPTLAADGSHGSAGTPAPARTWERRRAAAVRFLLEALQRYDVLERDDWNTTLGGGLLGRDQVEQIRRTAYEELLWLANDLGHRQQEHRSGQKLSREAAARQALVYLGKAESAYRPTHALYVARAGCRKALGEKAASQADRQLADKTPPTLAVDLQLRGMAAYGAQQLAEAVQAFEAALRLEPTHYWSLMQLGACLCDLGQRPEDVAGAARVFTGCILKRPDHALAYLFRANAYAKLRRYEESVADYRKAIELDPKLPHAHFNLGVALGKQGDVAGAIACYRKALELDPKDANAHRNLGIVLYTQKDLPAAVASYRKAIQLDPKDANAHCNLGHALMAQGDLAGAGASVRKAIELDPKDPQVLCNLGAALAELGDQAGAIACYRKAIAINPNFAPAHNNLGHVLYTQKNLPAAVASYRKAIELDPKLLVAHQNLGTALAEQRDLVGAVASYRKAIELDPTNASNHNNLGVFLKAAGDLHGALTSFRKAIDLKPEHANYHCGLGNTLQAQGDLTGAAASYRQAIELDPKFARAHNDLGGVLRDQRDLAGAAASYRTAIDLDPKFAAAHYNLGALLREQRDLAGAKAYYRKATKLDPKLSRAHEALGSLLWELGDPDGAAACLRKALELDPRDVRAHSYLGLTLQAQGNRAGAVACLRKALELDPNSALAQSALAQVLTNLGVALYKKNEGKKAAAAFREALTLQPGNAYIHDWLGFVVMTQGDLDGALASFREAIRLAPKYATAHKNLGNALRKKGDRDGAIAAYRKALKIDPKHVEAQANLKAVLEEQKQQDAKPPKKAAEPAKK